MIDEQHERFLELIVEYYNRRADWLENNTKDKAIAYRKVLKEIMRLSKEMMDLVQEIQHERRAEHKKTWLEKGYVPRKGKPRR